MNSNKLNKEQLLKSQSRIDKINELYKKRNHIASNGTSKTDVRIEKKEPINPFAFVEDKQLDSDDSDIDELQYTPKLKSRYTMERIRPSESQQSQTQSQGLFENHKLRKPKLRNVSSIKATLGDPLPLPYDTQNVRKSQERSKTVKNKRRLMENKWDKLLLDSKEDVMLKLNSQRSFSEGFKNRSETRRVPSVKFTSFTPEHNNLQELQHELVLHTQKLDYIIKRLDASKPTEQDTSTDTYKEVVVCMLWTICIIILILCNIYILKYL